MIQQNGRVVVNVRLFDNDSHEPTLTQRLHFSSAESRWETPQTTFDALNREFGFTLDACASAETAKCDRWFGEGDDAFLKPWEGVVFCNPPYGRELAKWINKGYVESLLGATVVMLIPARTDTAWFHDICMRGEIRFLRGRLKFGGAKHNAPFPSMVVVFRRDQNKMSASALDASRAAPGHSCE